MDIGIEETRKKAIGQLDYFKMVICFSINSLFIEENDQNDPEVIGAWQTIIRKKLGCLKELLEQHKENVAWSMLDEQQEKFKEAINDFFDTLTEYREFEDEPQRKIITQTIKLLKEGVNGFRQGFINDTYYEDLLHEERERYRQENYDRLEHIYQQDFADEAYDYPDETERKNHMVTKY